jgi:hypothetical protein
MSTMDRQPKATVLIFFGLFILWGFGWQTVGCRLWTNVDGIIVASRDVPSKAAPRYATEYTVRNVDGKETVYWAGPTDGSLPTSIRKKRWHLDYERDGKREVFPYIFYGIVLGIALGMLVWGVKLLLFHRKK